MAFFNLACVYMCAFLLLVGAGAPLNSPDTSVAEVTGLLSHLHSKESVDRDIAQDGDTAQDRDEAAATADTSECVYMFAVWTTASSGGVGEGEGGRR